MTDIEAYASQAKAWLEKTPIPENTGTEVSREFMAKLYDAGYSGISWPAEYGGQGLSTAEERVFQQAARGKALPVGVFGIGLGMCGPTLLSLGTEEQKKRYIRPLLRGEEIWCQLFSEPGAGSDIASLQTRAVRDEDGWVLSGQKVWTTVAQHADHGLIIARTDADVPKHKGITMFIVDMRAPGVTVRPLRDMTGIAHFNEVFFDDVRIAEDQVLGGVNNGWHAAITTLLHERMSIGMGSAAPDRPTSYKSIAARAQKRGLTEDPAVREKLVDLYIQERALELFNARLAQEVKAGVNPGSRGSVTKLLLAELTLDSAETAAEIFGEGVVAHSEDDELARYAVALAWAPGMALGGGTNEIVRNAIGERVLGLPREPQVDRDVPFRELKVGTQKKETGA
ncbi:acyl-CoA dehydrogenase family protein [Actinocorallia aurantiaca]|uniref:Acyl-CoA dehydrogenase family protein n=1 Tax=Actinocorallia aurantiaca TaxID=46204 RepID=A0ABP6H7P0_9ACTN